MRPLTDILRYLEYSAWLRDEYDARRGYDDGFTHRRFSELCGYRSSGAMSLIMSGRRNLSDAAAERIARVFDLDATERAHLRRMLAWDRADDFDTRARLLEQMQTAKAFAEHWQGTIDAYAFYHDGLVPLVRELVSLPDFDEDPRWMAARLHGDVAPDRCARALQRLVDLGHLVRDDDGRLQHAQPIVATTPEARSDTLKAFQRYVMGLAADALDSQPPAARDMRVTTMAISRDQVADIKALLVQLHKDVLSVVERDEPIEVVYQLNTQLFGITEPPTEPEPA